MKTTQKYLTLAGLSLLASGAFAQPAPSTGPMVPQNNPAAYPGPAAAAARFSTFGSKDENGAVIDNGFSDIRLSHVESLGMWQERYRGKKRTAAGLRANSAEFAENSTTLIDAPAAGASRLTATSELQPTAVSLKVRLTSLTRRDEAISEVSSRLAIGERTMSRMRSSGNFASSARSSETGDMVTLKEAALRNSLKVAESADTAEAWGAARTNLANDYSAYANAIEDAEVAAVLNR